jgi:hypothetical protein
MDTLLNIYGYFFFLVAIVLVIGGVRILRRDEESGLGSTAVMAGASLFTGHAYFMYALHAKGLSFASLRNTEIFNSDAVGDIFAGAFAVWIVTFLVLVFAGMFWIFSTGRQGPTRHELAEEKWRRGR